MNKKLIHAFKIGGVIFAVLTIVIAAFLIKWWPHDRLNESPEATFRRLIMSPIPASVHNIKVQGSDTVYQSLVSIHFEMSPEDLTVLLASRNYKQGVTSQNGWSTYGDEKNDQTRSYTLSINDTKTKASFEYWSS